MHKKHLRLAVVGRFVTYCIAQEMAHYKAANYNERKEMTGIIRHLRKEVGMSQRVLSNV